MAITKRIVITGIVLGFAFVMGRLVGERAPFDGSRGESLGVLEPLPSNPVAERLLSRDVPSVNHAERSKNELKVSAFSEDPKFWVSDKFDMSSDIIDLLALDLEEQKQINSLMKGVYERITSIERETAQIWEDPEHVGGSWVLDIPPFINEGKKIRELFERDLGQILGDVRSNVLMDSSESLLLERFSNFGERGRRLRLSFDVKAGWNGWWSFSDEDGKRMTRIDRTVFPSPRVDHLMPPVPQE